MNKRADLMDNVLTTIIAVVGLVIIFVAAWQLYSIYANQEETNARKTIDSIEGRFGNLENGQMGSVSLRKIPGWFIAGWSRDESDRPDKCYFKSCLCICKHNLPIQSINTIGSRKELADNCQAKGFCRTFEEAEAGAYEINNYKEEIFVSSPQDLLSFLKDPLRFNKEFEEGIDSKIAETTRFYDYLILFEDPANLVEVNLYKEEEFVRLAVVSDKGPLNKPDLGDTSTVAAG